VASSRQSTHAANDDAVTTADVVSAHVEKPRASHGGSAKPKARARHNSGQAESPRISLEAWPEGLPFSTPDHARREADGPAYDQVDGSG
jgi:hypothetical protein